MTTKYRRCQVYLTDEQYEELRETAFKYRVSISCLLRLILEESKKRFVDENEEAEILKESIVKVALAVLED